MLNLSASQKSQLELSKVSEGELEVFWTLFPDQTFEAAVGGVVTLLKGKGQVRNARFSEEAVEPSDDFKLVSSKTE